MFFILLLKLTSFIVVFCFIFFFDFVLLLKTSIVDVQFAFLSIIPIVFFPIIIENYLLMYIYKSANLIKRVNYRQTKIMLWIACIEFVILYIFFLWINARDYALVDNFWILN